MKLAFYFSVALIVSSIPVAEAAIKTQSVTYEHDGVKMKGLLTWDDAKKTKRPGVLVVHEWWGHNQYARSRAKKLARMGYTAFALDMYGNAKVATHPEDAGKFSKQVISNLPVAKGRFLAAKKVLMDHATVNANKIGAIGYCFGGSVALVMAREGVPLKAVASFHAGLALPPLAAKSISARVMVAHGGADKFIKPDAISSFITDMLGVGTNLTFISYPGVVHSFTNPAADAVGKKFKLPLAYNKSADQASWAALRSFLRSSFQ